jgi:ParB family chromosome partitioning protein
MIREVKVSDIKPNPFQARKTQDQDAIRSLANEIKTVGLWPGALRGRQKNGHIELCFGHRRLEAVKLLGWKKVEVVELSDEELALQSLIENLQREGLNDADRGDGIAAYIRLKTGASDLSVLLGHDRRSKEDQNTYVGCFGSKRGGRKAARSWRDPHQGTSAHRQPG